MSESAGEPGMGRRMRNALGRGATRLVPQEVMRDQVYDTLRENPGLLGTEQDNPGNAVIAGEHDTLDKREEAARANHRAEFPWLFDPVRGVRWDFDPILLRNLAQEATWVGMLVQSITKEIAQTPWTITSPETNIETAKRLKKSPFERDEFDEARDPAVDEIVALLSNPNPDHDWHDLVTMWMADLLEIGSMTGIKAYPKSAWQSTDDGERLAVDDPQDVKPMAIQPSPPEVWTKEYQDRTGILSGYWQFDRERHAGSGQTDRSTSGTTIARTPTRFDRMEVIWSDHEPRSNRRYGMAPTLLVKDFLKLLDLTVEQEQQYFAKGSVPSGAWVFENYDREQAKEWKEENEENIKGKPHKVLFLGGHGGDVHFEPMSFNYQELQFMDRMQWYARVIASVFQVPTAVVGLEPEQINYHTFQGERGNFESNTLGPYLQKIERVVNNQIVWPHWGREYQFEYQPGMSEERRAQISDRIRSEWDRDLIERNEGRRALGYDEVDDERDGFKSDVVDEGSPEDDLEMFSVEDATGQERETVDAESVRNVMDRISRESDEASKQDVFGVDVFRVVADPDDDTEYDGDLLGIGVDFPEHDVYVDWRRQAFPDGLEDAHVSIYGSVDDLEQATGNLIEHMETVESPTETSANLVRSIVEKARSESDSGNTSHSKDGNSIQCENSRETFLPDVIEANNEECPGCGEDLNVHEIMVSDSGNVSRSSDESRDSPDDPLRESGGQAQMFTLQPGDIEDLHEDIAEDVADLTDEILSDGDLEQFVDELAADEPEEDEDPVERAYSKSLTDITRRLEDLIAGSDIVDHIQDAIEEHREQAIEDAVERAISQTGDDIDISAITDRVRDRDVSFAADFADRMEDEIRQTVADGWEDSKTSLEISEDLEEKAGEFEGWGSEKIARQELQVSAGEARNEFASQTDRVEQWITTGGSSGDGRNRDAHLEMHGTWKHPHEDWEVDYSDVGRGVKRESVPGDSEPGIGCRCDTLLLERDEVDDADHVGV